MANDLYSQRGQDWFKTRMDNIASMMSMQNTDPMYQLGALISDYYLKPRLQNWVASQFGKKDKSDNQSNPSGVDKQTDVAIATYSPNQQGQTGFYNQQDPTAGIMTKEEMLHTPISNPNENNINTAYMNANREGYGRIPEIDNLNYSASQPAQANMPATQLNPMDKAPTQAEINEANNNQINQQVLNNAQQNNANTLNSMMALANIGNVGPAGANIQNMQQNQIAANMSAQQAENERRNQQLRTAISLFGGGVPLSFDDAPKSSDEGSGANSTSTSSAVTDNNKNTGNTANDDTNYVMAAINRYIDSNANNPLGTYGNYQADSNKSTDGTFSGQNMEEMITQKIIDYKNAYNEASAAGDTAGMQAAQQGAEQMRDIARANGISLSGIHEGNTLEDAKKRLDKAINFTSEEDAQTQLLNALYNTKYNYAVAEQQKNQAGMDKASSEANLLREIAKANGIDVTDAGSDVSLNELNQTIQQAQQKQIEEEQQAEKERVASLTTQQLLDEPEPNVSPDDFYQRTYLAMKKDNLPEWMARQMASDYADQYRARYLTNIQNGFAETGVNPDGTINQIGELFITKAVQAGAPELAQALISQYASPRDKWGYARDVDKANIKQAFTQKNLETKYNQNQELLKQKTNYQMQVDNNRANLDLQKQTQLKKLEHELKGQDEITKAAAREKLIQAMKAQGYTFTPEEERNYISSGKYSGGGGSRGSGSGSNSDKMPAWAGKFNALYENARGTLGADEIDKLKNLYNEHVMEMDDTTKTFLLSQILAVNFLAEKDHGSENKALEYASGIPPYLREKLLPGYDFSALDNQ